MFTIADITSLSPQRKQQQMAKCCVMVAGALTVVLTTKTIIGLWGADGAIYKEYVYSLYTLLILAIGPLSSYPPKHALKCMKTTIITDFVAISLATIAALGYYSEPIIILSIWMIITTNVLMRSIGSTVESKVVNGDDEYALLDTKLNSTYIAAGAIVGGLFLYFSVSVLLVGILAAGALMVCRVNRVKLIEYYYK